MTKLVGGLGNDDIVKAGLTYGRIIIRIRIVMSLIVGTVLLAISIWLFSKKEKKENVKEGYITEILQQLNECGYKKNNRRSNNNDNYYSVTVQLDKGGPPITVTTNCRDGNPGTGKNVRIKVCGDHECNTMSKNTTAGIILAFAIMFYCIAFLYYYFRNSKVVAGYAAYSSVFGSRSSTSSSGDGILGRVVDDAFGY